MADTSGFYRVVNDRLQCSKNSVVEPPDVNLQRADHATYVYPSNGWYWCDDVEQAKQMLVGNLNPRHITRLAFMNRFTDAEAVTIDLASQGATTQAAAMRRYQSKVDNATYIDLDLAETRGGVLQLEAEGVLAAGRALIILDAVTTPVEWFRR
jgi:hypothetical protein